MYFPDVSCQVEHSLTKADNLGIYQLINADWAAIIVITSEFKVIVEGYLDYSNTTIERITSYLYQKGQTIFTSSGTYVLKDEGELLVLPIRKSNRYSVFSITYKQSTFTSEEIQWMTIYKNINYKIVLLENEIAQEKNCLNNVYEGNLTGICNIDLDGNIVSANSSLLKTFNRETTTTDWNIRIVRQVDKIWDFIVTTVLHNQKYTAKHLIYSDDNETKFLDFIFAPLTSGKGEVLGMVVLCNDNTEKILLEMENRQLNQFAILGEIAVGIAHDVRNPLMNIRCSSGLVKKQYPDDRFFQEIMDTVIHEVDRINEVVEQLLNYCNINTGSQYTSIDINEIISQSVSIIQRNRGPKLIDFKFDLTPQFTILKGNKTAIQQALVNVLLNAVQAIHEKGTISISSRINQTANELCLTISDTGVGIPLEKQNKLFTHFYSTKPNGVGFGLSIIKRVMTEHNGRLELVSTPDVGTSFYLYFPT